MVVKQVEIKLMSKEKFVFFDAKDGRVEVHINRVLIGSADKSSDLADLLIKAKVSLENDELYHSSSVDFASEYGFSDNSGAYRIIEPALEILDRVDPKII